MCVARFAALNGVVLVLKTILALALINNGVWCFRFLIVFIGKYIGLRVSELLSACCGSKRMGFEVS